MKKLAIAGLFLSFLAVAGTASAATLYVDPSGEYDTGSGTTTAETTIQAAVNAAVSGDTIELGADMTLAQQVTVNKPLTIDGNGHTLFAPFAKVDNDNNSAIGVKGVNGLVVIQNLTIDGTGSTGSRHGINTYESNNITLEDVTLINNNAAGLIVNSSNVTANDLNTSGNVWYGVNVDKNATGDAIFTLTGNGVIAEAVQIITDKTVGATVTADEYDAYTIHGTTKTLWTNKALTKAVTIEDENVIYLTLQAAIAAASSTDTLNVGSGTYVEAGQIHIDKDLTISGNPSDKPVIQPSGNFLGANAADGWWLVDSGVTFNLSNVMLDGNTSWVNRGLRSHGNTTISNVDFRRIRGSLTGSPYQGFAVLGFGGTIPGGAGADTHSSGAAPAHLTVANSTFSDIGRVGVLIKGTSSTATLTGNTYTGKGNGDFLDYAFEIGAGGSATISGNTVSDNRGVASDGSKSAGVLVTDFFGTGSNASVNGNIFSNNTVGLHVGFSGTDASTVTAHKNDFSGETTGVKSTNPAVNAENNWWGTTDSVVIATKVSGDVDFTPWYTGPEITLNGNAQVSVFHSNGYTDEGATAIGLFGDSVAVTDDSDTFNFNEVGTYTITYSTSDTSGNTATTTRTVVVRAASSGGGGNSAGAASSQAAAAVANAGVTLPPQAAVVVGEVLGATTITLNEFVGQVLGAADVSVTILSAQAISALSSTEKEVHAANTKTVLASKISQLIALLQAELNIALAAQGL